MNKSFVFLILVLNTLQFAGTLVTLNDEDQRYASKAATGTYSGPITNNDGAIGRDVVSGTSVWYRSAVTFDPSATEDYAFVTSANVKTTTYGNPANSYKLLAMLMNSEPSTLSKSELWNDAGNGTEFGSITVPTSGLGANEVMPLNGDFYEHLEGQLAQDWVAMGMMQEDDEDETNTTYTEFDFGVLKFEKEIRMSTSGELSEDERWGGSHTLTDYVEVPYGKTLTLWSGLSLTLNSHYIKSTGGTITEQGSVSINPEIVVKSGSTIKGYYSAISSALSNAASGQTVRVYSSRILSSDLEVPSGVTLSLESGVTLTLYGNKVTTSTGTIALQGGSTVIPNIQRKNSAGVRKGLYPTIAEAISDAATNDEVYLGSASFTEDVDMPSNFELHGNGRSSTTINGDVTFDGVSSSKITNLAVNGEIVVSGGSSVDIHYLYAKDVIDIDLGSSHDIWMVTTQNSGAIELYCTSPLVDDIASSNSESWGITAYGSDYSSDDSYFENKSSWATYCTSSSDPELVDTEFCNNDLDIYATTGCTVDASDVSYFSYCDPAPTGGSGTVTMPGTCSECPLSKRGAGIAAEKEVSGQQTYSGEDKARELFEEALAVYRSIQTKMRDDRKDGRREAGKYAADYQVVADKMLAVVDAWPQTIWAEKALRYADYSYRSLGRYGDITAFLNDVQKKTGSESLFLAEKRLRVADFIRHKEYTKALTVLDDLIEKSKDSKAKLPLLYRKGVIFQKYLKDEDKATDWFSRVIAADSESAPAICAQRRLDKLGKGFEPGAPQGELEEDLQLAAANYPNPANPGTTIRYSLPEAGVVSIQIYNINGQRVAELVNADMPAGRHTIRWDGWTSTGENAATGVYFYRVQFGDQVLSRKFLLLR